MWFDSSMYRSDGAHPVRAFLGIPLPDEQRRVLTPHLEECARLAPAYRWVPAENLHLTLRFLGAVDPLTLERLGGRLTQVRPRRFQLALDGRGGFGPRGAPRVIWLGVAGALADCAKLAAVLEAACQEAGLEPEARAFRAHVTLARARPAAPRLPPLPPPPPLEPWTVTDFLLYESRLGGRAASYIPLQRYCLAD
jgi:RNA 2',3'-cyclic 3'-phosphodiesterase